MSDLKICRICLRTESKVYKYDRFQLKYYYEEVMALKVQDEDLLPQYFCYECATLLHKFHKFKEKCYVGQKVLREILWKGPITYQAVYKVDRVSKNLQSDLGIIKISEQVKSYITQESAIKSDPGDESEREIEFGFDNNDSYPDHCVSCDIDKIEIAEPNVSIDKKSDVHCSPIEVEDTNVSVDQKTDVQCSPVTTFVGDKEINIKTEVIKTKRKNSAIKRGVKNDNDITDRVKILDLTHWKKSILSEEEALKEFRARAEDPKYLAAAFKCTDCFKGFSKQDMLKRHKRLVHSEARGPFECRFCRVHFKWDCHLRKHMLQHFTKFQCLRCNLVCPLENTAVLHEESHSGPVKKCLLCNEEFRHMSTYYTHLRTHRSEFVCVLCGASFVSQAGLSHHKKIKHIDYEIESPDDDEDVNTFCDRCNLRFETRKAYEEHLFHSAMHSDDIQDELNNSNESSINTSSKKVLGKKEKAKITKELQKRKPEEPPPITVINRKRKRGIRRSHKKPTTCHQCGKHFETQAACMKHHIAEHPRTSFCPPTERHICEICGASLAPGSVAMHQNLHSREKEYPCSVCGRRFHAAMSMKRHMVTHTGEKPYPCSLCDKRFTQSNSMKLHYRTFHLKQPYPKRNRSKKKTEPQENVDSKTDDESENSREQEVDSMPEAETGIEPVQNMPNVVPERHIPDENMHYLTLS